MKKQSTPEDPIEKLEAYDNFLSLFPTNVDYDSEQLDTYLEKIISDIAEPKCEPRDSQNNLLRLVMLMYQADKLSRWSIALNLIDKIYRRSDHYAQSCARHLQTISRELAEQKKGGDSK